MAGAGWRLSRTPEGPLRELLPSLPGSNGPSGARVHPPPLLCHWGAPWSRGSGSKHLLELRKLLSEHMRKTRLRRARQLTSAAGAVSVNRHLLGKAWTSRFASCPLGGGMSCSGRFVPHENSGEAGCEGQVAARSSS